jgi:hypothetical protein
MRRTPLRLGIGGWNGTNVLGRDPEDRLTPVLPTLHPSRELFYQDHLVHAQRGAEIAVEALRFAEGIFSAPANTSCGHALSPRGQGCLRNDVCPLFWTLQFRTFCRSPDTTTLGALLKRRDLNLKCVPAS